MKKRKFTVKSKDGKKLTCSVSFENDFSEDEININLKGLKDNAKDISADLIKTMFRDCQVTRKFTQFSY